MPKRSVQASTLSSWAPTSAGETVADPAVVSARSGAPAAAPDGALQWTAAPSRSWPSLNTGATTGTASPTVALVAWCAEVVPAWPGSLDVDEDRAQHPIRLADPAPPANPTAPIRQQRRSARPGAVRRRGVPCIRHWIVGDVAPIGPRNPWVPFRHEGLRSFTVRPALPDELAALERLAMNLRWSWDDAAATCSAGSTPTAWDAIGHDPVRLLGLVSRERLDALAADDRLPRASSARSDDELARATSTSARWFQARDGDGSPLRRVAYFSPEFGIAEALPQYSGGLGVLAGDHLKAASDLGVPLVGIGLFYRHGYFRQALSADGWQQERYPDLDPYAMALAPCDGVRVERRPGRRAARAPRCGGPTSAGCRCTCSTPTSTRTPTDLRAITDRLYGGDTEHRLRQEILLGIGGVRALDALGIEPRCSTPTRATPASSASSASAS